jgi:hypothetical protein
MDDTLKDAKELVQVLIFLLPGFLTTKVIDLLVIRRALDSFDKVVQAFVFTFVNMIAFNFLRYVIEHCIGKQIFNRNDFFTAGNLGLMIVCSLSVGLCCAVEMNKEPILQRIRKWGWTKKTYKPGVWTETFQHAEKFVVVHLQDGRRIYGWPRFYSDKDDEHALYLEEASWLDDKNNLLNQSRISMFLDEKSGIQLVEFVDFQTTEKAQNETASTKADVS